MTKTFLTLVFIALMGQIALAAPLTLDRAGSTVAFSGIHAENNFNGTFQKWTGDISFDPANPAATKAKITFDLSSAVTGNKMYDGTLPKDDWFDIKNTPTATFESTSVTTGENGTYQMTGTLDLRGVKKEVTFDFHVQDNTVTATIPIKRMDFKIGAKSDPMAEWVSETIDVQLNLKTK